MKANEKEWKSVTETNSLKGEQGPAGLERESDWSDITGLFVDMTTNQPLDSSVKILVKRVGVIIRWKVIIEMTEDSKDLFLLAKAKHPL